MIKLVAFDLDGTTGDAMPLCIKSFKDAVFLYSGRELSDEDVVQTFGLSAEGMMQKALGKDWEDAGRLLYTGQRPLYYSPCQDDYRMFYASTAN
ncbi:MAG: HAD hydrolase-like protein [Dysgonamonadaceae bacterium]|jgi:phosphoglycolate phosphatase|nr:HAD hydrolase-like protein [Dysgonamonadaceae bacterium]